AVYHARLLYTYLIVDTIVLERDRCYISDETSYEVTTDMYRLSLYRPFMPQQVAFDRTLNNETYRLPAFFPPGAKNTVIGMAAPGSRSPYSVIASDLLPCMHVIGSDSTVYVARWQFEEADEGSLLSTAQSGAQRVSNIQPKALAQFQVAFGSTVTEDDLFAYVYGVLHSQDFRDAFAVNLKKEAPRVPLV